MERPLASLRLNQRNLNHHIWNNNGVWWIHLTLHIGYTKLRIRRSLGTRDLSVARARRDELIGKGNFVPLLHAT